jgi:hypothetical protein
MGTHSGVKPSPGRHGSRKSGSRAPRSLDNDIDHGPGKFVGPNHLVRKHRPKGGVDHSQQAVVEIRSLPRLDGIDVRGPKDVNARKTRRE